MTNKYIIPTHLSDIKLDHLIEYSKHDNLSESDLKLKALELLCGIPNDIARLLPSTESDRLVRTLNNTLGELPKERVTFEINGVTYGRIPNLNNISLGEHIDMDTFITPLYEGEIKHEDAFKFLSVLFRPIKTHVNGLYSIVDYDKEYIERNPWEIMKEHAPSDVYANSVAFFLSLKIELQKTTQLFLEAQKSTQTQQEDTFQKIGAGLAVCTTSQKETYLNLTRSAMLMFGLHSISYHSKKKVKS